MQDFLSEPEVAHPDLVVAGPFVVVEPASFPYDVCQPASAALGIGDASLVVAATVGPTYLLQRQFQAPLPPPSCFL
jgi:hypothetical protein